MQKDAIRRLYQYNRWANAKILDSAGKLTKEQFVAPDDTPFGSVRNELFHLLVVQRGWRLGWEEAFNLPPTGTGELDEHDYPDYDAILALWHDVEARTESLLDWVTDEHLAVAVPDEFDGVEIPVPFWEMMVHVVNHGTQHRSEVAMKLTNFGVSPGYMDIIFFSAENPEPVHS